MYGPKEGYYGDMKFVFSFKLSYQDPFELMQPADIKYVTLKTVF